MTNLTKAVIFDIDGTIADNSHRVHFLRQTPKDWDSFFSSQQLDTPIFNVLRVLDMYHDNNIKIILLTGRGEEHREVTESWLNIYRVRYELLVMRPLGNRTNDDILKIDAIKQLEKLFTIVGLFDDRARICEAARQHGLTVFQMAKGDF